MSSFELVLPARMSRVAIVAPRARLRDALVALAAAGSVELVGAVPHAEGEELEALRRLERSRPDVRAASPELSPAPLDVASCESDGARSLLAGEVELRRRAAMALLRGSFAILVGWTPTKELPELADRLAAVGAQPVELQRPAWVSPPTLFESARIRRPFRPLVDAYGVAP